MEYVHNILVAFISVENLRSLCYQDPSGQQRKI